jgi:hypothetical protein
MYRDETQFTRDRITNCHNTHVRYPNNSNRSRCKQLPTSLFGKRVVWSYRRPTNWAIRPWGTFNSRLIPVLPAGRATTSLEDVPLQAGLDMWLQHDGSPAHFGVHVTLLVLWKSLVWLWDLHAWPPRSPGFTPIYFYLWWYMKNLLYEEHMGSNTCYFKTSSLVHCQRRRSFRTASRLRTYFMS